MSEAVFSSQPILDAVVTDMAGVVRPGQVDMAHHVEHALIEGDHLLVQAGTGTGKSIGYLVPAMAYAVKEKKRVIISTATLALQRQIVAKDAPRVARHVKDVLGRAPVVKVLKGWSNYVCLRKAMGGYPEDDTLISRAEGEYGATATGEEVVRVREWAINTDTGDRDDVTPPVSGRAWAQVSISKPECIGDRCPVADTCFPRQARSVAGGADVVITNHAMLALQSSGTPVLPEADVYIVDEAHELADRVTNQLTHTLSFGELKGIVRMLRREKIVVASLEEAANAFRDLLDTYDVGRMADMPDSLLDSLVVLRGRLAEAADNISHMKAPDNDRAASKKVADARVSAVIGVVDILIQAHGNPSLVVWVTRSEATDYSYISVAPLDVSGTLSGLFDDKATVLASATLKVGDTFDHAAYSVGFLLSSGGQWSGVDVGSPFDYRKQGICYIATDLRPPAQGVERRDALERMVDLIRASGGGALCLFTSWKAAEEAAEYARSHVDVPILFQGDTHVPALIEQYRDDSEACLFGTRSLWQGVDVPGYTNRLVIIDRIPFPRPNDPLIEARSENIKRQKKSDFHMLSLPSAALLLSQGAGRLLRTHEDKGVVAILDSRLATKSYGGYLRRALPDFWTTNDVGVVCAALERLRDEK